MRRIRKLFRLLVLACLVALALCGIGINGAGPLLSQSRERYVDNGIKTELVHTKDEDDDSAESEDAKT